MDKTDSIETLLEAYYAAANALTRYRERMGFVPGARVICQFQENPPLTGTIPPYGSAWNGNSHYCVPVLLDAGYQQPWSLDNIRLNGTTPAVSDQP